MLLFIAAPAIIWGAQKTITTYTWDRNIQVQPSSGGAFTIMWTNPPPPPPVPANPPGAMSITVSMACCSSAWSAVSSKPWLTIDSGYSSGTGTSPILFHCSNNTSGPNPPPRTATITVSSVSCGTVIFALCQNGKFWNCP